MSDVAEKVRSILDRESRIVNEKFKIETTSELENPELLSMMNYVKEYWKEHYRPTLLSICCQIVKGSPLSVDDVGLAMSLITAGMAIHDDIIDNSKQKHFRETVYGKIQDKEKAMLIGDILIIKGLF